MTNDLESRIAALENRVAALEATLKGNTLQDTHGPEIVAVAGIPDFIIYYRTKDGRRIFNEKLRRVSENSSLVEYYDNHIRRDSRFVNPDDGVFQYKWVYTPRLAVKSDGTLNRLTLVGDTLREVKAVADLAGMDYDKRVKKEKLIADLLDTYGSGADKAVIKGHLLTSGGTVYRIGNRYDINSLVSILENKEVSSEYLFPEKIEFPAGATDAEKLKKIQSIVTGAKCRYNDDMESYVDEFHAMLKS